MARELWPGRFPRRLSEPARRSGVSRWPAGRRGSAPRVLAAKHVPGFAFCPFSLSQTRHQPRPPPPPPPEVRTGGPLLGRRVAEPARRGSARVALRRDVRVSAAAHPPLQPGLTVGTEVFPRNPAEGLGQPAFVSRTFAFAASTTATSCSSCAWAPPAIFAASVNSKGSGKILELRFGTAWWVRRGPENAGRGLARPLVVANVKVGIAHLPHPARARRRPGRWRIELEREHRTAHLRVEEQILGLLDRRRGIEPPGVESLALDEQDARRSRPGYLPDLVFGGCASSPIQAMRPASWGCRTRV